MMDKDAIVQVSMNMILYAGDARTALMEAYDLLENEEFEQAEEKMAIASKLLNQAHGYQTEIVQSEAAGEEIQYSPLFSHAQDTMMTIQAQYILSKKIFRLFKKNFDRSKVHEENNR
ncbi:PTS lactose/cellobiose transporter subunit IIA [Enterococcus hulanensis]|uniref:PTS lactose/cellobiose transporter subunit IIA n=1 Tax=Enterococcus hulanensis TaxID=2559929 RepID=A0ABU3EZ50_9ENTE|nr:MULTISPECIES: PTS lactose/cellobiose transporter subunit IIA [Enterococcus]MDT2600161.1 PTS lactose/cellobiose transporter subunit IIA [Enterococcus hulanensis]MDT2608974.1 PTS lactose/cellobiose transporter subunit IIA [Enterococcus hulanensis]MDT2616984.1 PTS lactose/cellobiose transporter subunit IIA [Enterococcus hulanensis]MDT2628496.1 PTS lactose/cellobiose transporter subunit IIA [Enterococcus hulanensis]MDT2655836.1 PTS lactose/cellobiose transporter subunit IIA [Enterococcus hulane